MSKLIYEPKGAAGEYAKYAINLFNGCSGGCQYCYNRKGILSGVLGGDIPTLKKTLCGIDLEEQLLREISKNTTDLKKHGIFFSFVSDPCLKETYIKNWELWYLLWRNGIPVTILTKQTWWLDTWLAEVEPGETRSEVNIGFTLTGYDNMEPGCATNAQRIEALRRLHDYGYKTWVSLEPIISFAASLQMVKDANPHFDHIKIGLRSGNHPSKEDTEEFMLSVQELLNDNISIYWKKSILKAAGIFC